MIPNPVQLLRRAVCAWRGHDPFPSNLTVARSRCWRCGRLVTIADRERSR